MAGPHRRRRGQGPPRRRVEIRVSEPEYEALCAAAAGRSGRGVSLSRYVVEAALAAAGRLVSAPTRSGAPSRLVLAEVADAVVAVNRVGNNLNQVARELHATGRAPVGTAQGLERVLEALQRLAAAAARADRP